jgi:hypothetical protein
MYIHELKCRRCGEMAKVRFLSPVSEVTEEGVELACTLECPRCGQIVQRETFNRNSPGEQAEKPS